MPEMIIPADPSPSVEDARNAIIRRWMSAELLKKAEAETGRSPEILRCVLVAFSTGGGLAVSFDR
jgi:hypothetical protein